MVFDSFTATGAFALAVGLTVLQRWLVPGTAFRRVAVLVANLALLSLLLNFTTVFWITLVALGCYAAGADLRGKAAQAEKTGDSSGAALLMTMILALVGLLTVVRYPAVRGLLASTKFADLGQGLTLVQTVGVSYVFFKLVHFLVDAHRGLLPPVDIVTFLDYIFFFPTYLAGPIDRYQNFSRWMSREPRRADGLLFLSGIYRLFLGAVKRFALIPLVTEAALNFDKVQVSRLYLVNVLISLLAYSVYIYLDFSGYSDLAIGTGMMAGVRVPENFRSPYLSGSISEFWTRWHMTLSSMLREYIFVPTVKGLSKRFKWAPRLLVSTVGYCVTMVLCGLWHGGALNYAVWGLWHAFGLAACKVWEQRRILRPRLEGAFWRAVGRSAAVVATFSFVTVGWLFFNYPVERLKTLWHSTNTKVSAAAVQDWTGAWGIDVTYTAPAWATDVEAAFRPLSETAWVPGAAAAQAGQTLRLSGLGVSTSLRRGLASGEYLVRLRYSVDGQPTGWIEVGSVTVPAQGGMMR